MKVSIFDYGMNGEGVAKLDGKIVLVPKAIVGEEVEIEITKSHQNYAQAKLINIIAPSPNRVDTNCQHTNCGGCTLRHMSYGEQLKFKQQLVKKTIKKIAKVDVEVEPIIACSTPNNYRNKASFAIGNNIGFYATKSHNIVPIDSCQIVKPEINIVLEIFKNTQINTKNCKFLVVRAIQNQILVVVVCKKQTDLTTFYTALKTRFKNVGVFEQLNTRNDSVVLAGKLKHIGGIKEIVLNNFGITYPINALAFHQTNEEIQNKIYSYVQNTIETNQKVINAYSGAGLLSAIIAKKANYVWGVELDANAHKVAQELKANNKLENLTNIKQDFARFLQNPTPADWIVLDPPKKGCGKILENLSQNNIIYISCNPISLAKDLHLLLKNYIIETVIPFDMFPNTVSVETIVVLRRKK